MKKVYLLSMLVILFLLGNTEFLRGESKDFSIRPIEMIVPFPPGGNLDIVSRIVMDQVSKELKITVAMVNKPGASGTYGTTFVTKGNPDGHLLLTATAANLTIPYFFLESVSYDAQKDLAPLAYVGESPSVLCVQTTSPFKKFEDLLNYAKKNPGKLSYATAGVSSVTTLMMEVIKSQTGMDASMIIYEGGGPSIAAIIGGHVDFIVSGYPALGPQIEAGKLRVLLTTKRGDVLPNVPTLAEKGFNAVTMWSGFFAPSRIPKATYTKLVAAFNKALEHPVVIKKLKEAGYVPERKTPAEINELLKQQYNLVSKIVKESNIKK